MREYIATGEIDNRNKKGRNEEKKGEREFESS